MAHGIPDTLQVECRVGRRRLPVEWWFVAMAHGIPDTLQVECRVGPARRIQTVR
jgi:hypothetical protein